MVAAVVITGLLHLVCKPLGLRTIYIVGTLLGFAAE